MKTQRTLRGSAKRVAFMLWIVVSAPGMRANAPAQVVPVAGTWTLAAAYEIKPDGTRIQPYGEHPAGLLMMDVDGRYSLQIYRPDRPHFAAGDKQRGTADEYKAAVLGISTHIGSYVVDAANGVVIFRIARSSFPNLDGAVQRRQFTLHGDEFSYRIPPTPNGNIPVSVWRRVVHAPVR
jgi:hypothetical protein